MHSMYIVLFKPCSGGPCEVCSRWGTFFSLHERLYVFFTSSYVQHKQLKMQSEIFECAPSELQRLSDTRCTCRYITCPNLMDRLSAVKRVLEDISEESHPDRAAEARGLLGQIDSNFTGLLSVFKMVLGSTIFFIRHASVS